MSEIPITLTSARTNAVAPTRMAALDVLRTAAVVAVIASHWAPAHPGNRIADK